jgi:hypothetical protein
MAGCGKDESLHGFLKWQRQYERVLKAAITCLRNEEALLVVGLRVVSWNNGRSRW